MVVVLLYGLEDYLVIRRGVQQAMQVGARINAVAKSVRKERWKQTLSQCLFSLHLPTSAEDGGGPIIEELPPGYLLQIVQQKDDEQNATVSWNDQRAMQI